MAQLKHVPPDDPICIAQAAETMAISFLYLYDNPAELMTLVKRFYSEHPKAFAGLAPIWKGKCKGDADDMADWELRMSEIERNRQVMEREISRYPATINYRKLVYAFGHINAQCVAIELRLQAN